MNADLIESLKNIVNFDYLEKDLINVIIETVETTSHGQVDLIKDVTQVVTYFVEQEVHKLE